MANERSKVRKFLGELIKKTDLTPPKPVPAEECCPAGVTMVEGRAMVASWALAQRMKVAQEEISRAIRRIVVSEGYHREHFKPVRDPQGRPGWWLSFEGFALLLAERFVGVRAIPDDLREAYLTALRQTEERLMAGRLEAAEDAGRQAAAVESSPVAAQPASGEASGGLLPVPFQGATLFVVDHQGEPYAPMKPIVEGMGLAWEPQFLKLKSERFASTITEIVMVAQDGKQREMTCMPVRKLAGWLMTVSPNKVRPALREKIIAYQRECDDVLWRHWTGSRSSAPAQPATPPITRQAGPYVLDSEFFRTLHLALGRRAVKTEIIFRLLGAGALDQPVSMTIRALCEEGTPDAISTAGVHRALMQLIDEGLVAREPESSHLKVVGHALDAILRGQTDADRLPGMNPGLKKLH